MGTPVRAAFCNLLWAYNGGQFGPTGLPLFTEVDEDGNIPLGTCDRAYDCSVCPLLHQWVERLVAQGWSASWECSYCLKGVKSEVAAGRLAITGYYQAGREPVPPEHEDHDQDQPALTGCTRCGWQTSFLQLVLRRP